MQKKAGILVVLLFLFIYVTGIFNLNDYGVYCDYDSEMPILFMNLQAYGKVVLGEDSGYVAGLGDRDVLTDKERDHGMAALYPIMPLSMIPALRNDGNLWMLTFKGTVFSVFFIGLIALYLLCMELFKNRIPAVGAVLMTWLYPRFFAESTYNNKDVVAFACTLILMYAGYRFLNGKKKDFLWPIIFAFAAALNTNMRVTGIILFGVIGIFYIIQMIVKKELNLDRIVRGIIALVLMPVFYIILTPATWQGNLFSYLDYLLKSSAEFNRTAVDVFLNGELYNSVYYPPGPEYVFKYMLVTIPPVFIVFSIAGAVFSIRKFFGKNRMEKSVFFRFLIVVYFILTVLVLCIAKPVFYNGWRHMYSLYAPVVVMAACALNDLFEYGKLTKIISATAVSIQLILCIVFIAVNHPLEFSYYNALAGSNVAEKWDGDYWGVGMGEVLKEIADSYGPCSVMSYESIFVSLNLEHLPDEVKEKVSLAGWYDWNGFLHADYIIANSFTKRTQIKKTEAEWIDYTRDDAAIAIALDELEPVMEFKCGEQVLYEVYENPFSQYATE